MQKGISASGFVGDYWRVSVSGDLSKIPMRDKIAAKRTQKKRHLVHGITIEPIGIGDYYGFEIDGDHLFLLGDFTVTTTPSWGCAPFTRRCKRQACHLHLRPAHADRTDKRGRGQLRADGALCIDGRPLAIRPRSPFQIASAQTLARRQWPDVDLIVIDEAHVQMSVWVNKIKSCTAHVDRAVGDAIF